MAALKNGWRRCHHDANRDLARQVRAEPDGSHLHELHPDGGVHAEELEVAAAEAALAQEPLGDLSCKIRYRIVF